MKKKKEAEQPKKWYHKLKAVNWGSIILFAIFIGMISIAVKTSLDMKKVVKKDVINNYICQVVGSDEEVGILALKCMTK